MAKLSFAKKFLFTFLEADGVHDGFALNALKPRLDDLPFRGIHHNRYAADVGLGGDELEEAHHCRLRVEHAFVHVDVDYLSTVRNLLTRDFERFVVVFFTNQPSEFRATRDVGSLANVNEKRVATNIECFEPR